MEQILLAKNLYAFPKAGTKSNVSESVQFAEEKEGKRTEAIWLEDFE